ncbi:AAA family ATPase [Alkalihalobacterium chitinilyticum]|uniref:AAA family ATPase n=1 Tax=Alkalihalobacterium chitinilyticum TaxID=2980103 RepID=A0ABT5VBJ6_9BACI|nr:AAA family ATPase [Alkalihalobacterium chitinilyticum]MDE5412825.1 AAA family ATPase [Alkalihalobacterium chitinilyticum]
MNELRVSIDQIQNDVQVWLEEPEQFIQEALALRYLTILEDRTEPVSGRLRAAVLSLLALKRSNRYSLDDPLLKKWLDEALTIEPNHPLANEIHTERLISQLEIDIIPEKLPQIRETDHGASKKKIAQDYFQIANQFFSKASEVHSILHQAKQAAEMNQNNKQIETVNQLEKIITDLHEPMLAIAKATEAYQESATGIFYSASQLKEIRASIKVIEELKEAWQEAIQKENEKMTSTDQDQYPQSLKTLNQMIGLKDVKERVKGLYHFLQYQRRRKEEGFRIQDDLSLNMIITGNPGTGKTMLARLLAKIYYELGVLPREDVLEVDRSQLVGGFVGQTEENTINMIEKSLGGILFIDEAYSLKREGAGSNDYGQAVIDTLVSAMSSSDYAGKFAVILAGYPEEMRQFLWANPGLRSRFPEPNHIHLPDYSIDELLLIGERMALDNDFVFSMDGVRELRKRIETEQVDETFGNARTVKNIVLDAIFKKGSQVDTANSLTIDQLTVLDGKDVKADQRTVEENAESALEQLSRLIGLDEVKREVQALSSLVRVQQLRAEKNMRVIPVQLHSIFTGNPGTGKTTVAKLFSKLLKEMGLLKRGHVVVAGRTDLVAGYMGQTAIKTKKKIREALGGVLFIDEAYSLAAGGEKDFGREAIDTLVEEMTRHNENLVVILAGYPNEMKHLIGQNPGLESRFKKYIHFDDYSKDEILRMVTMYALEYGYQLDNGAINHIEKEIQNITITSNGRYAVNLVELAIREQAQRICQLKEDEIQPDDLMMLMKEDFVF